MLEMKVLDFVWSLRTNPIADPAGVWGEAKQGALKRSSLVQNIEGSLVVEIVGYHCKILTFSRKRKWLFLLVTMCDLWENQHALKALYITNSNTEVRHWQTFQSKPFPPPLKSFPVRTPIHLAVICGLQPFLHNHPSTGILLENSPYLWF